VQLYHDIIGHILDPLIQLQQADAMPFWLLYHGQHYNLKLNFLGNTEWHDRLCGCYNMCGIQMARLCRHCDTPKPKTATVDYHWGHILPADIAAQQPAMKKKKKKEQAKEQDMEQREIQTTHPTPTSPPPPTMPLLSMVITTLSRAWGGG
jgi:hypothetical protein